VGDTSILANELHTTPPPEFAQLSDTDLARFTQLVADAKLKRDADVQEAIDESLTALPAMLRTPVRKVLGL
jgi:hypothetical protein